MATWNVQGCRGKMQETIKEMEQLEIDIASIMETKRKVLAQKLLEITYIFIAVSQKKTGQREEFLY
jgi:exonuclease III